MLIKLELDELAERLSSLEINSQNNDIESDNLSSSTLTNIQSSTTEAEIISNPLNLPSQTTNMASLAAAKEIAHILPTFDGQPIFLESFISLVEKFYNTYYSETDNTLNDFIFMSILSKLKDKAANVILCRPDLTNWPQVKEALRKEFGDHSDRNALLQNFMCMRKGFRENPINFLNRVKQHLARLNVKISTDDNLSEAEKKIHVDNNEKIALDVILRNVDETLKTILMVRNPKDLTEAETHILSYVHTNQRINMIKGPNLPNNHKSFQPKYRNTSTSFQKDYRNPNNGYNFQGSGQYSSYPLYNQPGPSNDSPNNFPRGPINIQPRQVNSKNYPTNSQVFGKQKNVFAPNKNYVPNFNSTPMSISTRQSKQFYKKSGGVNHFSNNNQQPNFLSEELYNLNSDQTHEYDFQEPNGTNDRDFVNAGTSKYSDQQNFQLNASETDSE